MKNNNNKTNNKNKNKDKIPTSNLLFDVITDSIESTKNIIKTIIKGAPVYAASIAILPLYFKVLNKLYTECGKFIIRNTGNMIRLSVSKKPFLSSIASMYDIVVAPNELISLILSNSKTYIQGLLVIPLYFKVLNKFYEKYSEFIINHIGIMIKLILIKKPLLQSFAAMNDVVNASLLPIMALVGNGFWTYFKGIFIIPMYFKMLDDLYGGYGKFFDNNFYNMISINVFKKMLIKTLSNIYEITQKINDYLYLLHDKKTYKKAIGSIVAMSDFLNAIVGFLTGDLKVTKRFLFWKWTKKTKVLTLEQIVIAIINMAKYMVLMFKLPALFESINKVVESIKIIKDKKAKKVVNTIGNIHDIFVAILTFLNEDIIQNISIRDQLKTTAKLLAVGSSIVVLTGILAIIGAVGVPVMMGILALRMLLWGIKGLFCVDDKFDKNKEIIYPKSINAFNVVMVALGALLTVIVTKQIVSLIVEISKKGKVEDVLLGVAIMSVIVLSFGGLFILIDKISKKIKDTDGLNKILTIISGFVAAWAAAKIAETIAPIGKKAIDVFLGIAVVSAVTIAMIGILYVVQWASKKLDGSKIKIVMTTITEFIVAWATAKIAETIAPIGPKAKEILIGTAVACAVIIMIAGAFWLVNAMLKNSKLIKIAIGMTLMATAVLLTMAILATSLIFTPFALLTMAAVMLIAGMAALIGLLWKPIIKGALAMAVLGLAMYIITTPLILFSIAGAIMATACGSPEMILTVTGAMIGFILAFALMTVGVGALMSTGLIELGAMGMAMLGGAMILVVTPLLIFANAVKTLSETDFSNKNMLADAFDVLVNGLRSLLDSKNSDIINPASLAYAMVILGQISDIAVKIGLMASVVQKVASLSMPTEWDSKGKPTKWVKMKPEDFVEAATNIGTIIAFFAGVFGTEPYTLPNGVVVGGGILSKLDNIDVAARLKVKRIMKMVGYAGDMAETLSKVAALVVPDVSAGYTDKGTPKKWRKMKEDDFMEASVNLATILSFFATIFGPKKALPNGVVVGGVLDNIESVNLLSQIKVKRVMKMVGYVGTMADSLSKVAALVVPDETAGYNTDGTPKKWRAMKEPDFAAAKQNIGDIMTFMITAVVENADKVNDIKTRNINKISKAMEAISPISSMVDAVVNIAQGRYPKEFDDKGNPTSYQNFNELITGYSYKGITGINGIKTSIADIMSIGVDALVSIDSNKIDKAHKNAKEIQSPFESLSKYLDSIVKLKPENADALTNVKNNTSLLIDKVNKVDLSKLKYMYSLVAELAKFSNSIKGDFDKLAETINKKLVDALEKLKEVLDDTNKSLKDVNKPNNTQTVPGWEEDENGNVRFVGFGARNSSSRFKNSVLSPEATSASTSKDNKESKDKVNTSTDMSMTQVAALIKSIDDLVKELNSGSGIYVKPASNTKWPEQ